ncbi:MAG: VanW family protein, partial [Clostridia bacterium]|nr:VanW family protein [Clostridia bacterium]
EIMNALNREQLKGIHVSFASAPPDEMTLQSFDNLVYRDALDARYEINGNEVTILPGQPGRFINKEEAAPFMEKVYEGCEPVRVPYYTAPPANTEQQLKDKLFADTLASYSTSYGGSTSNRCANVARAASLINGKVLAPGEVFSFNDTVGKRTTANGFYTAKEYINGKSVDGIGGGTCQVSSTLYSAVLYADMNIVERLNHMMSVGYIPLGQDATVSDSGVDFKFRNSSDYPVKISAYTNGSTITISIIGTQWDPARKVELSHSRSQSGNNTIVHSKRYVYANGELISTDSLNSSTYMPHETESNSITSPSSATSTEEENEVSESSETSESSSAAETSSSSSESSATETSEDTESSEE